MRTGISISGRKRAMNEQKIARINELYHKSKAEGLTEALANKLIQKISVFPDNQIKIEWKIKDFCVAGNEPY